MATFAVPSLDTDNTQQQLTKYFIKQPEICGEKSFKLNRWEPNNLALEAQFLIETLKKSHTFAKCEDYQIELRQIAYQNDEDSTYQMHLRIDPIFWFKNHPLKSENIEELYQFGLTYVENVNKEIESEFQGTTEEKIRRISASSSVFKQWCRNEREGYPCQQHTLKNCRDEHHSWCDDENLGPTGICCSAGSFFHSELNHVSMMYKPGEVVVYQCQYIITKLNRETVYCAFYVDPNFRIYHGTISSPSSYPYFLVSARHDATPVITLNPVKHCVNEEYIQTSDAWQAVFQTLMHLKENWKIDRLPLDRIYINFGTWMQQKNDDPARRFCHAHVNIVLTRNSIEKLTQDYERKKKKPMNVPFAALIGSILPATCHRLDDAGLLFEHMNNHMTPLLKVENEKLMRMINSLREDMKRLQGEIDRLNKLYLGPIEQSEMVDEADDGTEVTDSKSEINDKIDF